MHEISSYEKEEKNDDEAQKRGALTFPLQRGGEDHLVPLIVPPRFLAKIAYINVYEAVIFTIYAAKSMTLSIVQTREEEKKKKKKKKQEVGSETGGTEQIPFERTSTADSRRAKRCVLTGP